MPIATRILCSVTQNAKHVRTVRTVRMRSIQRNTLSKNNDQTENTKLVGSVVSVPSSSEDELHVQSKDHIVESNFQSENQNLKMKTKIIDEGHRILVLVNTEWIDRKTNQKKTKSSQSVYDI